MKRNALALSAILVLLLALTSTLNSFVFADCFSSPSGLLHWYRGESNGLDSVGTNHAVLESGATAGVAAKVGNGFLFNGDALGGGANLGNVPDLDFAPGSSFSIEAWFNSFGQSDGGNDAQSIVMLNNSCGNTVQSLTLANTSPYGAVIFVVRDATGQTGIVTSSPVSSNAFHHVVGVRQVSGGSNTVTLYIDGALVGSQVDLASGVLANNANDLIGRRNICGTQNTFFGLIDEVSIYSRALTANEVAGLFVAGSAGKCLCARPASGIIAWWPGEANAQDIVGTNNGTLAGVTFATGKVGQGFSFSGVGTGISIPDAPALRPANNLTIEGWIKTTGVSGGAAAGFIAARSGVSGNSGYELGIYPLPSSELRFTFNGGDGGADLFSTNGVADNNFHHVAATYDGATMRVYRDGICEAEKPLAQGIAYSIGNPFWIGRRQFASIPGFFPGSIDELTVYDRALSGNEIAAIYAAGSYGKCEVPPRLNIAALPAAVRLTWTTNATGYLLETNATVTTPAGWGVLTSNYNLFNAEFAVTNTIGGATRFYRLHKP